VPGDEDDADTPNTQAFSASGRQQSACHVRGTPLVYQQRGGHAGQVSLRRGEPVRRRDLLRRQGLHDHPRLFELLYVPRPRNEPGPFKTAGQGQDKIKGQLINWSNESVPHFRNWVNAVRSRKHEDLNADVEQGHLSTTICHLAKISCKLGRSVHFDPKTERFVSDTEADKFLKREYRKPYVIPEEV